MLQPKFKKNQKGAALVVSLVLLAVITILGVTGMQSSNTELKLVSSMRDRGVAFEAAEAALAKLEVELKATPPERLSLMAGCSGSSCFNSTCDNGLCFDGEFDSGDEPIYCEVSNNSDTTERINFWDYSALDVWNDATKHKTVTITGVTTPVKYITEFLCFVEKNQKKPFNALSDANKRNGAPLFRITVLAQGDGGRASVSLQSTYKAF